MALIYVIPLCCVVLMNSHEKRLLNLQIDKFQILNKRHEFCLATDFSSYNHCAQQNQICKCDPGNAIEYRNKNDVRDYGG